MVLENFVVSSADWYSPSTGCGERSPVRRASKARAVGEVLALIAIISFFTAFSSHVPETQVSFRFPDDYVTTDCTR